MNLTTLQRQVGEWSRRNFPDNSPTDPFLGVVEEVGELSHAILKMKQGIRGTEQEHRKAIRDAVGDITIFLADFCERNAIDFDETVEETWGIVKRRDWRGDPKQGASGR